MPTSDEMFYRVDGKKQDKRLHDPILDNPKADATISAQAVARAIAGGMTRDAAERLYGIQP